MKSIYFKSNYYLKQEEFKKELIKKKGWEKKYVKQSIIRSQTILVLRIKHLKEFKNLGMINHIVFNKNEEGLESFSEFKKWLNTPNLKSPKLYFETDEISDFKKYGLDAFNLISKPDDLTEL